MHCETERRLSRSWQCVRLTMVLNICWINSERELWWYLWLVYHPGYILYSVLGYTHVLSSRLSNCHPVNMVIIFSKLCPNIPPNNWHHVVLVKSLVKIREFAKQQQRNITGDIFQTVKSFFKPIQNITKVIHHTIIICQAANSLSSHHPSVGLPAQN